MLRPTSPRSRACSQGDRVEDIDTGVMEIGFLASLLVNSRVALQVFVAAAAVALLHWHRFQALATEHSDHSTNKWLRRVRGRLLAHLAALGCFTWITSVVVQGGEKPLPWAIALGVLWAAMALATFGLWVSIWLPPDRWRCAVRGGLGISLGAAAAGLAAWGAGRISSRFWEPLCRWTLETVERLLRLFFSQTVVDPLELLVGTPAFQVEVAPGCSGFEGIGLMIVLIGSFLWIFRGELRFPRALILIPLGGAVIWVVNTIRIVVLICLGTWGYRGVATADFTRWRDGWDSLPSDWG